MSKERLSEKLQAYAKAYKEPPYGREVDGTVEILEKAAKKLAEYESLENKGLLLRLPCKVGDTVWEIVDECEGDSAGCCGFCDACNAKRLVIKETRFSIDMIDEVENWFFLTQSEAEAKLRELEGK